MEAEAAGPATRPVPRRRGSAKTTAAPPTLRTSRVTPNAAAVPTHLASPIANGQVAASVAATMCGVSVLWHAVEGKNKAFLDAKKKRFS